MQVTLWQRLMHQILPSTCLWCLMPVHRPQAQLCDLCLQHLPELDLSRVNHNALLRPDIARGLGKVRFDSLLSLSWYQQPYQHWISSWKFRQQLAAGQLLCQLFAAKALQYQQQQGSLPECVSYTPISVNRWQERGFNQAKLLAEQLAQVWNRPCVALFQSPQLVPHQTGLNRRQRLDNLKGKIQLLQQPLPNAVVLVDDVITTGATMDYLTALLKAAGVQTVSVWTLAITARH